MEKIVVEMDRYALAFLLAYLYFELKWIYLYWKLNRLENGN